MAIENLINGNKLPILFVGSGFSRRYIGSPDWEGLLKEVYYFIGKTEQEYKALKARVKNDSNNRSLTDGELNAVIASLSEEMFNNHYYESELMSKYPDWLGDDISPFKRCIANIVSKTNLIEEKKEEITMLKKLRGKVASVVTTNYDTLLEEIFGFHENSIFIGQSQMFNPLSVEIDELYKIHGCVTKPELIIITEHDYQQFKEHAKLFSAKLLTLMSENPVVFIGYKIGDPNIQQTLIDLVSCLTAEQMENLQEHFYIVEYQQGLETLEESKYFFSAKSYEGKEMVFPISVIRTDNYLEVYRQLSMLTPAMNISAVKQVKRIVKDIVIESTATTPMEEPIITVLLEDIQQLDKMGRSQKFAIAIGNVNSIKEYGYGLKPHTEIFEDILLDNKSIDPEKILRGTYEKHYLKVKQNIPIYKYAKEVNKTVLNECPKVKAYILNHSSIESYLNSELIRSLKTIPIGCDLKNIPSEYKGTIRRRYLWIFKNIERLSKDELKNFLLGDLQQYQSFDGNAKSYFNRLISIYDYLVYK